LVDTPLIVVTAVTERGPIRGAIEIVSRYDWPLGLEPGGAARSEVTAPIEVTTKVELRVGEPFVRLSIAFTNPARDHRLRWHLPLPGPVDGSSAEGQFAVVDRGLTEEAGHGEVPTPTFPAHGFVHATGATILLDHVIEYEVVEGRELALTVLRSTGLISRNDNPFREDPAGPEVPIPAAQMVGPWRFAFGLLPNGGSWEEPAVRQAVEAYQLPFVTVAGRAAEASPEAPAVISPVSAREVSPTGLRVDGRGIVLSALRRRGDWLEVRLVLEGSEPVEAALRGSFHEARRVDLLGRPGEALPIAEPGLLRLELGPWEIATVRLRTGRESGSPDEDRGSV
jgi:alpha-mannosidase